MSLSTIERVLFLKAAELFNQIQAEDLVPLALIVQEIHFAAGETFIWQGEAGDCLYIIVEGEAKIIIRGVGQVAMRSPKSSIGEMSLISRQPRTADCMAVTDMTALRIDHDDFWDLLAEKPPLALGVIKALSQRLNEAVANLQKLSPQASP